MASGGVHGRTGLGQKADWRGIRPRTVNIRRATGIDHDPGNVGIVLDQGTGRARCKATPTTATRRNITGKANPGSPLIAAKSRYRAGPPARLPRVRPCCAQCWLPASPALSHLGHRRWRHDRRIYCHSAGGRPGPIRRVRRPPPYRVPSPRSRPRLSESRILLSPVGRRLLSIVTTPALGLDAPAGSSAKSVGSPLISSDGTWGRLVGSSMSALLRFDDRERQSATSVGRAGPACAVCHSASDGQPSQQHRTCYGGGAASTGEERC